MTRTQIIPNSSMSIIERFMCALVNAIIDTELNRSTGELHTELVTTLIVLSSTQVQFSFTVFIYLLVCLCLSIIERFMCAFERNHTELNQNTSELHSELVSSPLHSFVREKDLLCSCFSIQASMIETLVCAISLWRCVLLAR